MLVGDVKDEGGREGGRGEKERKWGRLCAWSYLEFRIIISHKKMVCYHQASGRNMLQTYKMHLA